jgi:hypothetical protein
MELEHLNILSSEVAAVDQVQLLGIVVVAAVVLVVLEPM